MTKQNSSKESSVEKALTVLSTYAKNEHEMGITEVSVQLGLHKSTASRLIKNLMNTGFLQQNPNTKKYFLGRSAYQIGQQAVQSLNNRIIVTALPYLKELSQQTGETTALELLFGYNVFLAIHVEGPGHLRFTHRQGELVPINVSVGAKSILSHATNDFLEICLQRKLERFNENTVTSSQQYREILKKVRVDGVAFDRGERYQEMCAIGTPVILPRKTPESAIVISGPASRMTNEFMQSLIIPIKQTAKSIARALQEHGDS